MHAERRGGLHGRGVIVVAWRMAQWHCCATVRWLFSSCSSHVEALIGVGQFCLGHAHGSVGVVEGVLN